MVLSTVQIRPISGGIFVALGVELGQITDAHDDAVSQAEGLDQTPRTRVEIPMSVVLFLDFFGDLDHLGVIPAFHVEWNSLFIGTSSRFFRHDRTSGLGVSVDQPIAHELGGTRTPNTFSSVQLFFVFDDLSYVFLGWFVLTNDLTHVAVCFAAKREIERIHFCGVSSYVLGFGVGQGDVRSGFNRGGHAHVDG